MAIIFVTIGILWALSLIGQADIKREEAFLQKRLQYLLDKQRRLYSEEIYQQIMIWDRMKNVTGEAIFRNYLKREQWGVYGK